MKKLLFLTGILFLASNAQTQVIDSMIRVYAERVPDQKVYVHFDKDIYRPGEAVWFKAYLLSGFSLSAGSKNFYAELTDAEGRIIQRKVYPITASAATGNFDLPDSIAGSHLVFRGYTTWMLNFDEAFLFQKDISLTHPGDVASGETAGAKTYSLQFFPEGGNLVSELHSVVAFKANDEAGVPVSANGKILDSKGAVITGFTSLHDGMGVFDFTPDAQETYQAIWFDLSGRQQSVPLPAAKAQGLVLRLTGSGNQRFFHLFRTDEVPDAWKKVHILALMGQETVFRANADLNRINITSGAIPVASLPSGILQVTVFSAAWEPIAERIVFINNNNYRFEATVNTAELNLGLKEKNILEIAVEDSLPSNLSLSVTDATAGRQTAAGNIISTLLLTGDIKGAVHDPEYYFVNNTDSIARHLDLLMLTHGWRRYNWAVMAAGHLPALKYLADDNLAIVAKVPGLSAASPPGKDEQLRIFIQSKDASSRLLQMPKTGPDQFTLADVVFYDTATVYYDLANLKRTAGKLQVNFSNNFFTAEQSLALLPRPVTNQPDTAAVARIQYLAEKQAGALSLVSRKNNTLAAVTVKGRSKTRMEQLDERYTSGLFRGAQGYAYDLTDKYASSYTDVFAYLQGKVPGGLQVQRYSDHIKLLWRGSTPALYLDEIPVFDAIQLSSVSMFNIAYVKVLRPPFMGVYQGGAGGALAVYTKRGADEKAEPVKGSSKSFVTGYSAAKEFFVPGYKDASGPEQAAADYRSTLYWNPMILTDSTSRKIRFTFYNNNTTKAFRIVLEGVNSVGKMTRVEKVVR